MKVPAAQFKAKCLKLMDRVKQRREEVTITKRGQPVARLVPASRKKRPVLGSLAGTVTIIGDLTAPIPEKWEADA